ncbi:MAG: GlsB/YeaQ/YmgE family stress response membrane protein [Casimicrobiaceae bacterium]
MGLIHIIWSIVVGFVVGLIARAVVPGVDAMGFIATVAVGIVGSLIGGFIGNMVSKPPEGSKFHPAGFLMSLLGAIILLVIWRYVR